MKARDTMGPHFYAQGDRHRLFALSAPEQFFIGGSAMNVELEIRYTPEHWNQVCQATIPAAWEIVNDLGFIITSANSESEAMIIAKQIAEVK